MIMLHYSCQNSAKNVISENTNHSTAQNLMKLVAINVVNTYLFNKKKLSPLAQIKKRVYI